MSEPSVEGPLGFGIELIIGFVIFIAFIMFLLWIYEKEHPLKEPRSEKELEEELTKRLEKM